MLKGSYLHLALFLVLSCLVLSPASLSLSLSDSERLCDGLEVTLILGPLLIRRTDSQHKYCVVLCTDGGHLMLTRLGIGLQNMTIYRPRQKTTPQRKTKQNKTKRVSHCECVKVSLAIPSR